MPGWLKVILIIFGVMVLVVVGLSVTGYYWFRAHGGELKQSAEKLKAEGEAFGKGKTASACLDQSLDRLKRSSGFVEQVRTQVFFMACRSTAEPSPELCAGLPPPDELIATGKWAADQCAKRGLAQSQGCVQLYNVVATECRKTSR